MILKRIGLSIPLLAVILLFAPHALAASIYTTNPGYFGDSTGVSGGGTQGIIVGTTTSPLQYIPIHQVQLRVATDANTTLTLTLCNRNNILGQANCNYTSDSVSVSPDGGVGPGQLITFTFTATGPGNTDDYALVECPQHGVCDNSGMDYTHVFNIIGNTGNTVVFGSGDPTIIAATLAHVHGGAGDIAAQMIFADSGGVPPTPCSSGETRLCDFTPEEGDSLPSGDPVVFSVQAYVNDDDIGSLTNVVIKLHNIDQNVLLASFLSPSDIVLLNEDIDSGGQFNFSTTTFIGDGNYRLEASIRRKFFFDWITVPGSSINQTLSHQFVIGSSTFIGNLTQNGFAILNGQLASSTATSSIALVAQCNPLGDFNMTNCLSGLFIPDAGQVQTTLAGARDGIITRMPWGYITRFVNIVSATTTSPLPTWEVEVAMNTASDTTTFSFDPGDMLAGAGALLASTTDPHSGLNIRQILEPLVQLAIGIAVIFTIVSDITGSHRHGGESPADDPRRRRSV